MNRSDFEISIMKELTERLDGKYESVSITKERIEKMQDSSYDGIIVRLDNSELAMILNIDEAYGWHVDGLPVENIAEFFESLVHRGNAGRRLMGWDELSDYEKMKPLLSMRVVSTERNRQMLANVPHHDIEDLSLIYRIAVESLDGYEIAIIDNNMLESFGIEPLQLHWDALNVSAHRFPAFFGHMSDYVSELTGLDCNESRGEIYVASCTERDKDEATVPGGVSGAACMFYPGFLQNIAERIGGDFYILPSSIHEVIIIPTREDIHVERLKSMVIEINAIEVEPKDRLTDSVYYYSKDDMLFKRVS